MRNVENTRGRTAMTSSNANSGIGPVVEQLRDERQWLTLMRLHFGVLCLSWLLLVAWATPGTPLSAVPDYSAAMVLGLLLALIAAGSTAAFLIIWKPSFHREPFSEFVRVVLGAGRLIRRRSQFDARLRLECRKARGKRGETCSVVVVELATAVTDRRGRADLRPNDVALQSLLVRSIARTDDVVAEVRPSEVWVLAVGADETGRTLLAARLGNALAGSNMPGADGARIGAATYGSDSTTATDLLAIAHDRLAPTAAAAPEAA